MTYSEAVFSVVFHPFFLRSGFVRRLTRYSEYSDKAYYVVLLIPLKFWPKQGSGGGANWGKGDG